MSGARAAAVLLAVLATVGCSDDPVARVVGPDGATRLEVWVVGEARTADERMTGLRGREPLGEAEGLLIVFPLEGEVCIVNDGVGYAIDVVFADDAGAVVAVEHDVPAEDGLPRCHVDTRRVLEVRAGVAAAASVGDRLVVD